MVKTNYSSKVTTIETTECCPMGQVNHKVVTISLIPLSQTCRNKKGLAIDHALTSSGDEANLASSSYADSGNNNDLLGVVVSYSLRVSLCTSGMGDEVKADVPFKLMHPRPGKPMVEEECIPRRCGRLCGLLERLHILP